MKFKLPKPYNSKRVIFHCCYFDKYCRKLHDDYNIPMRLIILNRNFVLNQGFTKELSIKKDIYPDEME